MKLFVSVVSLLLALLALPLPRAICMVTARTAFAGIVLSLLELCPLFRRGSLVFIIVLAFPRERLVQEALQPRLAGAVVAGVGLAFLVENVEGMIFPAM